MRYNLNREVNEMQCREDGLRETVNSSDLMCFLGDDQYQDKAEEMLLDILNGHYDLEDAIEEVKSHVYDQTHFTEGISI